MIFKHILDAIFPPRCVCCDKLYDDGVICPDCNSAINWLDSDFFGPNLTKKYFDTAKSLASHEGVWAKIVHNLKYNKRTDLVNPLADLLSKKINFEYDLILNVPLHPKRLRERGYNQSGLIARRLARSCGMQYLTDALKRVKYESPQVGLTKVERMKNVKNAFEVKVEVEVEEKHILLIDDVMTTGATVNECAKVLKKSGAGRVDVLTIARTL